MGEDSADIGPADLASVCTRMDVLTEVVEGLEAELRFVRAAIDEVNDRLDDGLVLDDDLVAPAPSIPTEVIDALAALRDEIAVGFDALRAMLPSGASPGAADGGLSDHAVEELRGDMAALRRRIAVRAEGRVLSDEQLEQIAETVAERLAGSLRRTRSR